jgi:hypothetical protein
MQVAEVAAAYKEGDEVGEALLARLTTRQRTMPAPPRPRPAGTKAKDFASFGEALLHQ